MQQADRIGFVDAVSVALRFDVELVERAVGDAGNESFPDAGRAAGLKRCVLGSHPLKLPTTETERAFGAHTLKTAPAWPL